LQFRHEQPTPQAPTLAQLGLVARKTNRLYHIPKEGFEKSGPSGGTPTPSAVRPILLYYGDYDDISRKKPIACSLWTVTQGFSIWFGRPFTALARWLLQHPGDKMRSLTCSP